MHKSYSTNGVESVRQAESQAHCVTSHQSSFSVVSEGVMLKTDEEMSEHVSDILWPGCFICLLLLLVIFHTLLLLDPYLEDEENHMTLTVVASAVTFLCCYIGTSDKYFNGNVHIRAASTGLISGGVFCHAGCLLNYSLNAFFLVNITRQNLEKTAACLFPITSLLIPIVIGSTVAIIEDFCFPDLTSDSPTCGSICNKWVLLVFYLLLSFVITTLFVLRVLAGRKLVELEEQYGRDEVPVQIAEQISVSFKLGITGVSVLFMCLVAIKSENKTLHWVLLFLVILWGVYFFYHLMFTRAFLLLEAWHTMKTDKPKKKKKLVHKKKEKNSVSLSKYVKSVVESPNINTTPTDDTTSSFEARSSEASSADKKQKLAWQQHFSSVERMLHSPTPQVERRDAEGCPGGGGDSEDDNDDNRSWSQLSVLSSDAEELRK
ncbi:uncharacterized protein LOC142349448 [Convolutriloba macropyga]|uniref:uncharacterized protein LOC142349448 n=1 Tax=Convolutriloba macropyga TaxID=536237 RepID=UPI003F51EA0D